MGTAKSWVPGDWAVHQGWLSRARSLRNRPAPAPGVALLEDARAGSDLESHALASICGGRCRRAVRRRGVMMGAGEWLFTART